MVSKNELWIDLHTLFSCSNYENEYLVLNYDYTLEKEPNDDTTHYSLRVALRALGHKITKIKVNFDDEGNAIFKSYYTSINREEGEEATEMWNKYAGEIYEEIS